MAGEVVLRKRLRLTLDFEATVEGLTEEGLWEHYSGEEYKELLSEPGCVNLLKQVRLQRTLLEDESAGI